MVSRRYMWPWFSFDFDLALRATLRSGRRFTLDLRKSGVGRLDPDTMPHGLQTPHVVEYRSGSSGFGFIRSWNVPVFISLVACPRQRVEGAPSIFLSTTWLSAVLGFSGIRDNARSNRIRRFYI